MDMEVLWDLVGRCFAFCPTSIVPSLVPVEVLTVNNRTYRVIKQVSSRSCSATTATAFPAAEWSTQHSRPSFEHDHAVDDMHACAWQQHCS
jgi:hypothetical protein